MPDCIILAGGLGTRLQSVVNDRPKCLANIGNRPFLAYLLDYLQQQGVRNVVLSLGYKHELVEEWLLSYSSSLQIKIVVEEVPLGTGGGIKLALEKTTSPAVLVVNGDTLFAIDVAQLYACHQRNKCQVTLGLKPMRNFDRYGRVLIDKEQVTEFCEKQFCTEGLINGGVFILQRESLQRFPDKFSFEKDFLEQVTGKNIGGYIEDGYFIDIGIPEDYERAQWEITQKL
jgi:D-glycero-alpha-D-manno-heptose 1-phosphate guanylyltransferase